MKILFARCLLCASVLTILCVNVEAQGSKKKTTKPKTGTSKPATDPFGNPIGGSNSGSSPAKVSPSNNTSTDPFGSSPSSSVQDTTKKNIPVVVIPSKGGGNPLLDSTRMSLRMDGATEPTIKDRTPLPYDYIRDDDAVYKQRLWEVIDTREKMNLVFRNPRVDDNGSQLFFAILFKAVTEGGVTAFEDDRFTVPISKDRFIRDFAGGGYDTSDVKSLENPDIVIRKEVRPIEFPVDSVYKFQIKEDVIFDKEASRMVRRIIGIAPMMPTLIKGKVVEGLESKAFPKFWVYYPDMRPILAKYEVFNPKNLGAKMSWEDLLEGHMFSSYIIKSSLNNSRDLALEAYINDPLFRLFEGEKIKEKIFNYEQDLWSY